MLVFDEKGWCPQATQYASPNFNERPEHLPIDLIVVHNISLPPNQYGGPFIIDFFQNKLDCDFHPYFDQLREMKVSSHFFIRRDGELVQFVSAFDRAWHAGVSFIEGRSQCNDFSIGIEMEGSDFEVFTNEQYKTLNELVEALCERFPIQTITGHQHIAPTRKTDPGPYFDWALLEKEVAKRVKRSIRFYK